MSLQSEKGAANDRQKIQMGFRKGNTVLVHLRRGNVLYQSVLIMHEADLKQGRLPQDQHKHWRYVSSVRTYFDCGSRRATIFCSTALEVFPERQMTTLCIRLWCFRISSILEILSLRRSIPSNVQGTPQARVWHPMHGINAPAAQATKLCEIDTVPLKSEAKKPCMMR